MGITGKQRAYIVRNFAGTPDSSDRGLAADTINGLYMYANVIMAGWRADMSVGFNPNTASGYWFRAVLTDFAPKIMMAAMALGYLGDEAEEWMSHVSEYEKEKYIILPLPPFYITSPNGEKKAVYLRLPHMDTNRVLAALTWMLARQQPHAFSRAFGQVAGEFPGVNPAISLAHKWGSVAVNKNPQDPFWGTDVIPSTAWEAGGWARARELAKYSMNQFGVLSATVRWAGQMANWEATNPPEEGSASTVEKVAEFAPTVNPLGALIRFSNRGLKDDYYTGKERVSQKRAQVRDAQYRSVTRAVQERARMNDRGVDNLDPSEQNKRVNLNTWYRVHYLPLMSEMELYHESGDKARFNEAKKQLRESLKQYQ